MTTKPPRLGRVRKHARLATAQTAALLKKHGAKIDPAHRAEIEAAATALTAILPHGDAAAIQARTVELQVAVDRHLAPYKKSPTREYFESIAFAIAIALLLRAFIIEAFTIPSGSMIPTLAVGDFLFVNKLSYGLRMPFLDHMIVEWDGPDRGDVVVFVYPCDDSLDYIKRVIAIPGDEVEVDSQGFVWINGARVADEPIGRFNALDRFDPTAARPNAPPGLIDTDLFDHHGHLTEYVSTLGEQRFPTLHYGDPKNSNPPNGGPPSDWNGYPDHNACGKNNTFEPAPRMPWVVPAGHVFVMGDNRGRSQDSRYWGFVPFGAIKGKAMFIWLSWDSSKSFTRPWEKIRWSRMFSGVHAEPGDR